MATMTGAGIGVWYGDMRPGGGAHRRTGGVASGPMGKMRKTNDGGRELLQGGNRRCAIWAGLPWWHPDMFDVHHVQGLAEWLRQKKQEGLPQARRRRSLPRRWTHQHLGDAGRCVLRRLPGRRSTRVLLRPAAQAPGGAGSTG
jgi:ribonucleotide reductase alpha subunit